jgi:hypothetical protein
MTTSPIRERVDEMLSESNGIVRLEPAWVARDFLPPGRRLGLPDSAYDVGERGFICERWLGSTTKADNRVGPPDEGLSYLVGADGRRTLLRDAVEADPVTFLGAAYARSHPGLERLAKIFDYEARVPYHLHPTARHAGLVGRKPKDESYYFPSGVDLGAHPESFFGVHPWIAEGRRSDVLLPYLVEWDSNEILKHARGEMLVPEEGFHIPSGVLHAPGTALTIELQEDSDVLAMFQALNAGKIISKDLLFKDVRPEDRERPVLLREPAPHADPGWDDRPLRRRRMVDLLQHDQVQWEEARHPAGPGPLHHRARRLQPPCVARDREIRRPRDPRRPPRHGRAVSGTRCGDTGPACREHRPGRPRRHQVLRARHQPRRADVAAVPRAVAAAAPQDLLARRESAPLVARRNHRRSSLHALPSTSVGFANPLRSV